MTTADRPAVGVRRIPTGWQAYIRIRGEFRSRCFPPDTPLAEVKAWRSRQQARALLHLPLAEETGEAFGADCRRYLQAVAGMPTISDRTYRINQWRLALGAGTPRATITALQIRAVLEKWRMQRAPLAPASLNQRRTALMHLFTTLDGKSAINPVRDVPPYREEPPPLRLPTLADAIKAVAASRRRFTKRDDPKSWARLQVLLWTGWPAKQLTQLTPDDVDWSASTALVRGRRKGKGTRDRRLPLLPQAVAALKTFAKVDAWGPFDNHSLRKCLHRGCRKAGVKAFRVYDLRHLFAVLVATTTKDDRVVAELLMHTDTKQTRRYTEQSVTPRVLAGLASVHLALSGAKPRRATKSGRKP